METKTKSKSPIETKLPDIDLLKEMHNFPEMFTFKVIGDHHAEFAADILNHVVAAIGPSRELVHSVRMSAQGNHAAVTVQVMCNTADEVHGVYEELMKVRGLRALF